MGLFGSNKKSTATSTEALTSIRLEDGSSWTPVQLVDCIGDSCPRPQLMTKKAVNHAAPGDIIEVRIDNPTSMEAIPPMMPGLNARHLGTVKSGHYWSVLVAKD
jgi:tRNA 2-thiouridine synthesizing protein A